MPIKTYKIFNNLVDIFLGDGWETWSRWKQVKNSWIQVAGPPCKELEPLILKNLKGN